MDGRPGPAPPEARPDRLDGRSAPAPPVLPSENLCGDWERVTMSAWGLGVDLGTSFSAAATATGDRVEILEVGRERRIPSTVLLDDAGSLLAGSLAQRLTGRSP